MDTDEAVRYRFGEFELDPIERQLCRNGVPVKLTPKHFDLLHLLVAQPQHLWTKEEIFTKIWPDVVVQESSLTAAISSIRKEVEASGQECIKTIHTKGYRFIAEVQVVREGLPTEPKLDPGDISRQESLRKHSWAPVIAVVLVVSLLFAALVVLRVRSTKRNGAELLFHKALEFEKAGNDTLAVETLNEVIRLDPSLLGPRVHAAWIAWDDDDSDAAEKYLEDAAGEKISSQDETSLIRGEALQSLLAGSSEDAIRKLKVAATRDPNSPALLYELATLELQDHDHTAAERWVESCLKIDPKNGLCWLVKVQDRVDDDDFTEALVLRDTAEKTGVSYPWLDQPAAYAYLAQGDQVAALAEFHKLEAAGRQFGSELHFRASQEGLAAVALYRGRLDEAKRQIQAAIDSTTSNYDKANYLLYLADADSLLENRETAEDEIQSVLRNSDSNDIKLSAAVDLAAIGRFDRAAKLLDELEAKRAPLGKDLSGARQFTSGLRDASEGNVSSAIARLKDAYRFDDSTVTAYYLAKLQMESKLWADAANTLIEITKSKGRVLMEGVPLLLPLAEYRLGVCASQRGDKDGATKSFAFVKDLWRDADPELKRIVTFTGP